MKPTAMIQKITVLALGVVFSLALLEGVLFAGGCLFRFLQERSNTAAVVKKGSCRILCLGESMTALGGFGAYPNQLQEILNRSGLDINFKVINGGVPVINSSYIVDHLEENINMYHPDIVTTMMGCNDLYIKYYENIPDSYSIMFNKSRTYRFLRMLWVNMMLKVKRAGIYKQQEAPKVPAPVPAKPLEDVIKKVPAPVPVTAQEFIQSGIALRFQGRELASQLAFEKACKLDPQSEQAFLELAFCYRNQQKFPEAENAFRKAIAIHPRNSHLYVQLGLFYMNHYLKSDLAEEVFRKAVEIDPRDLEAQLGLGGCYEYETKFPEAEQAYKKALVFFPGDRQIYKRLGILYAETGREKLADEYFKKAAERDRQNYNLTTDMNYQKLKGILDKRGIKLVCVQYPMRSIEPLKSVLRGQDGVIFVDNEVDFREALKTGSLKDYFIDMFAGDFGHCTPKGNRLIAQNIADAILKDVFHK